MTTRRGAQPATEPDPVSFTLVEAAALCGVSQDVLKEAVRTGRLRGKRSGENGGGLYLFSRAQLESWFDGLVDA